MSESLVVNEIYISLQGESTFAGLPCIFVRLTGCDLRCSYCDTVYAFSEGRRMSLNEIKSEICEKAGSFQQGRGAQRLPLIEVTGGEPLLQKAVLPLMRDLCDEGLTVLIETSGAHEIGKIDPRVRRIVDLKCPSSGEMDRNRFSILEDLRATDEVKFVIGTREDYQWAKDHIREFRLDQRCPVLMSWVSPLRDDQRDASLKTIPAGQSPMSRQDLAECIVEDALPVRFQLQMHKYIWSPDQKGV